ncbi:MAG: MGMT family protein [Pseudomonadota bacterium]
MEVEQTPEPLGKRREAVWQVVAAIPPGFVAGYGQVAALAGLPGRARWVGRVLSELPADTRLPWHRVVTASGQIADRPGAARQRARLRDEGVLVRNGRIASDRFWPNGRG